MTALCIGDQQLRFDREATVIAYSEMRRGDADHCTCTACRNFALLRDKAYPGTFRSLLNQLGIDARKEGEAVHYGPKGDLHFYGGWFTSLAKWLSLASGSPLRKAAFSTGFRTPSRNRPKAFEGQSLRSSSQRNCRGFLKRPTIPRLTLR
jgi:hypothetical protein